MMIGFWYDKIPVIVTNTHFEFSCMKDGGKKKRGGKLEDTVDEIRSWTLVTKINCNRYSYSIHFLRLQYSLFFSLI